MQLYKTLYADPPWWEQGGGKIKRGADRHYELMKTNDIKKYLYENDIASRLGANAHLYLWTTNNFLADALDVMEYWRFRYVTTITWFKQGNVGLGQYFRDVTEHCLFGVRGTLPYKISPDGKRQQGMTGFIAPRDIHSAKPEQMRQMIETVSYPPYLELFARQRYDGWDSIGKELPKNGMDM